MTINFFHLSLLLLFLDPGSGMGKNQDPGSGINIPDPQHWIREIRDKHPGPYFQELSNNFWVKRT
jgi:hypothetical protein